jgi:predicted alpha/beta-hydrolase family hydrolase
MESTEVRIEVPGSGPASVSCLFLRPVACRAAYVFGHGAGAGMRHRFMDAAAAALAGRGVATLRYQFPYMEEGRRAPDRRPKLLATVRAAVAAASELAPDLPRFAGGKSMGGRMTSAAAAEAPLEGVRGLVFFGFPLHPSGKPGTERGDHLAGAGIPMLFLQGSKDRLAELELLRPGLESLTPRPTLHGVDDADHGVHGPKRSGRTDEDVIMELADTAAAWMGRLSGRSL